MAKDKEKSYNGSYLYRLNEEMSGQAEIGPYLSSLAEDDMEVKLIEGQSEHDWESET